jgi:hypothetical protein
MRANIKCRLMQWQEKILLRKRSLIETVNDTKNVCQIEHSRYRSPINFLAHLIAGLAAYTRLPKKHSFVTSPENFFASQLKQSSGSQIPKHYLKLLKQIPSRTLLGLPALVLFAIIFAPKAVTAISRNNRFFEQKIR